MNIWPSKKANRRENEAHQGLHLHDLALGNVALTCGYFCMRGLKHHKSFWRHHTKPAKFARE